MVSFVGADHIDFELDEPVLAVGLFVDGHNRYSTQGLLCGYAPRIAPSTDLGRVVVPVKPINGDCVTG